MHPIIETIVNITKRPNAELLIYRREEPLSDELVFELHNRVTRQVFRYTTLTKERGHDLEPYDLETRLYIALKSCGRAVEKL